MTSSLVSLTSINQETWKEVGSPGRHHQGTKVDEGGEDLVAGRPREATAGGPQEPGACLNRTPLITTEVETGLGKWRQNGASSMRAQ